MPPGRVLTVSGGSDSPQVPHEELPNLIDSIHPTLFQEKLEEAIANLRQLEAVYTSYQAVTAKQIIEWNVRAGFAVLGLFSVLVLELRCGEISSRARRWLTLPDRRQATPREETAARFQALRCLHLCARPSCPCHPPHPPPRHIDWPGFLALQLGEVGGNAALQPRPRL